MAARTSRLDPSSLTGLMPMPELSGKRIFSYRLGNRSWKTFLNVSQSSLPSASSTPA